MKQEMKLYKATNPNKKYPKTIRAYNIVNAASFARGAIRIEQVTGTS